jgi:hypothetical protein
MHSGAALRLVHESPARDLAAAEVAAAAFIEALGISLDSESLRCTPGRMARGYAELFNPRAFDLTTFPNDEAPTNSSFPATFPCDRCASIICCPLSESRGFVSRGFSVEIIDQSDGHLLARTILRLAGDACGAAGLVVCCSRRSLRGGHPSGGAAQHRILYRRFWCRTRPSVI